MKFHLKSAELRIEQLEKEKNTAVVAAEQKMMTENIKQQVRSKCSLTQASFDKQVRSASNYNVAINMYMDNYVNNTSDVNTRIDWDIQCWG